jgi:dihydroflavonol-4-reductase
MPPSAAEAEATRTRLKATIAPEYGMGTNFVTGASGFIGFQLVRELIARGDDVHCLARRTIAAERLKSLGARVYSGDVTDSESLAVPAAKAEAVYHLAGAVRARSATDFLRTNQAGVANVLDACRHRTTPPTVVMVSSLAAAGPSRTGRSRTEEEPPQPVSNYGRSKRAGELEAVARAGDLPITIIRPPIVMGAGDAVGLTLFRMIGGMRLHLVPGWRRSKFSVVHVGDLVSALLAAAKRGERLRPSTGEINDAAHYGPIDPRGYYYVAGEWDPTYDELGRLIGEALGRRRLFVVAFPRPVVWPIAVCGEIVARVRRRAPFAGIDKAREALAGHWTCSAARAQSQLGFAPASTIPDWLRQTADWYRREKWL